MENTCGTKTHKPWMTRTNQNSIKKRQSIYKQHIWEKTEEKQKKYLHKKKQVQHLIKIAKAYNDSVILKL